MLPRATDTAATSVDVSFSSTWSLTESTPYLQMQCSQYSMDFIPLCWKNKIWNIAFASFCFSLLTASTSVSATSLSSSAISDGIDDFSYFLL